MKNLIIFSVIAIIAVGIFGVAYPHADQIKLSNIADQPITARGSDLVTAEKSGEITTKDAGILYQEKEIYKNWPVYSSDEYGFSVRYPLDFQVNASTVDILSGADPKTLVTFIKSGNSQSQGVNITISAQAANAEKSLDDVAKEWQHRGDLLSWSEMTVDGVRSIRMVISTPLEGGDKMHETFVLAKKGDSVITLQSAGQDDENIFEQMLETVDFKF